MFIIWNKDASAYVTTDGTVSYQIHNAKTFATQAEAKAFIETARRKNSWVVKKK